MAVRHRHIVAGAARESDTRWCLVRHGSGWTRAGCAGRLGTAPWQVRRNSTRVRGATGTCASGPVLGCQLPRVLHGASSTSHRHHEGARPRGPHSRRRIVTRQESAARPERRLMAVLAHPDDESLGIGGLLAAYAASGVWTYLVTATCGERGRFFTNDPRPSDAEVGRVRGAELRAAARVLGVREVALLDYMDGELDHADSQEAVGRIVAAAQARSPAGGRHLRSVRRLRPPGSRGDLSAHHRSRSRSRRSGVPERRRTASGVEALLLRD